MEGGPGSLTPGGLQACAVALAWRPAPCRPAPRAAIPAVRTHRQRHAHHSGANTLVNHCHGMPRPGPSPTPFPPFPPADFTMSLMSIQPLFYLMSGPEHLYGFVFGW